MRGIAAAVEGQLRAADGREANGRLIVLSSSNFFDNPFISLPKTEESRKHEDSYGVYMAPLVQMLPTVLYDLKMYKHCEL